MSTPEDASGPPTSLDDGRLAAEGDMNVLQQRVVDLAVAAIRGCQWASLTQLEGGQLQTTASTARVAQAADAAQYRLEEGPSLDACLAVAMCLVRDTSSDIRWPRWTRTANSLGVGSVLTVRLATSTRKVGAIALYAARSRAFHDDDVKNAQLLAAHAADALARTHELSGVQKSLDARHTIEIAQEILMAADDRLTPGEAFRVLRHAAESSHTGLRHVAEGVIERRNASMPIRLDSRAPHQ